MHAERTRALAARFGITGVGRFLPVDGCAVHVTEQGEGDPVLFLHGLFGWSFCWRRTLPALGQNWRCIALDLMGHGLTERNPGADHSIGAQAGFALRCLDALGIARAALVGHSTGGEVAQRMAILAPDRVRALALVSSTGAFLLGPQRPPWWLRFLARLPGAQPLLRLVIGPAFARRFIRPGVVHPDRITDEAARGYIVPVRVPGAVPAFLKVLADFDYGALAQRLREIKAPTLVLHGRHDPWIVPRWGEDLHRRIPASRLAWLETGHLPFEEEPAALNAALAAFLQSLPTDPAPRA